MQRKVRSTPTPAVTRLTVKLALMLRAFFDDQSLKDLDTGLIPFHNLEVDFHHYTPGESGDAGFGFSCVIFMQYSLRQLDSFVFD